MHLWILKPSNKTQSKEENCIIMHDTMIAALIPTFQPGGGL